MALPTMAKGYAPATTAEWCSMIDEGPFSSVSCGERITFPNPEMMVTCSAAAALTRRVRVLVNLAVTPLHPSALLAKQLATLDQLAGGRLTVAVGVGGREQDYQALGVPFGGRHQRLDRDVEALRALWRGDAPFAGAEPVGPAPVQVGGPEILAGAMGPRSMARAAAWADGISGFSLTGDADEISAANQAARQAFADAGRTKGPRLVSGCFFCLGGGDDATTLARFTQHYLQIFGEDLARAVADSMRAHTPAAVAEILTSAQEAGCDEFVLVPASTDPSTLSAAADLVGSMS